MRRMLVTTNRADRIAPGLTPYIWNPALAGYSYGYAAATTDFSAHLAAGSLPSYADPSPATPSVRSSDPRPHQPPGNTEPITVRPPYS